MYTVLFPEFEAYTSALRDIDVRVMLPKLISPFWQISSVALGDVFVQYGREGSGTIADGAVRPGGRMCFIPMTGHYRGNGTLMNEGSVLLGDSGAEFAIAVPERHDWFTLFLPDDTTKPSTDDHADHRPPSYAQVKQLGSGAVNRIRSVVQSLFEAVRIEPTVLSSPLALQSLRDNLSTACRPLQSPTPSLSPLIGRTRVSRQDVLRAIRLSLEQFPDRWPSLRELAGASHVSERTIRNIFHDQYGVSPRRFLMLHRMHEARAALRSASPATTTVTAVAARFGFWHFGRFAARYRRLFGERPSETLSKSR